MKLRVGQTILCTLAGSDVLSEQTVASFTPHAVRLTSGDVIKPSWVLAALTP
jgi:hypothetical protein